MWTCSDARRATMRTTQKNRQRAAWEDLQATAGNGLLDRRAFLRGGAAFAAAMTGYALAKPVSAEPLADDPWSKVPGDASPPYEQRSRFEEKAVGRTLDNTKGELRTSRARTPHLDPDRHLLVIHGLVQRPLVFTLEALARYPMVSRMAFVECGGNSAPLFSNEPIQANVQALHGLVSCSEWTGVLLSTLLEETGIDPKAKWLIAEGADASHLSRSVPLTKGLDDAMIALYQNGERLMPGNGYPMRLLLPGWEGNMNIKWLRRIELTELPSMSFYESKIYAPILPGGKAYQFYFLQEVKSFITHPSPGLAMKGPGFYEISGIAYSGNGRISKVMVSADGGKSWAEAALQAPVLSKAFTRFRVPWRWDGGPVVLQSRAWDEAGYSQPTRSELVAVRGETTRTPPVTGFPSQHYNAITSWSVER